MSELFVGIDIGTGSTKGVVTDKAGTIITSASVSNTMNIPKPDYYEMDAQTIWWESVSNVAKQLTSHNDVNANHIKGITVSGLGPGVVACDKDGITPLHPGILYGIDARASQEIEEINAKLGSDNILARCGKALSSQAVGPKITWISKHVPGFTPESKWYSAHTYAIAHLTGEWILDHHTASQCDPLYDIVKQDWATDFVDAVVPGLALPRLAWPSEQVGTITASAAEATGFIAGTPVMAGTVDAWAEAFSAGVSRPGDLMLMYGSTMFMVQVLPAVAISAGLWTTAGVINGSHTLAAGMSTSGSLTTWLQQLFGDVPFEDLIESAKAVGPGSDGLVVLPYFAGERSPIYDPDARGLILGLTLRHSAGHIFNAAYEGIAFGIKQIIQELDEVSGPPARVVCVGGGTQSEHWMQIVSDICGVAQEVPAVTIGACYGDALLAAIGVGAVEADTVWAKTVKTIVPNPQHVEVYRELYQVYDQLYGATKEQMHALARLQRS